jgi:hypothetical protein
LGIVVWPDWPLWPDEELWAKAKEPLASSAAAAMASSFLMERLQLRFRPSRKINARGMERLHALP